MRFLLLFMSLSFSISSIADESKGLKKVNYEQATSDTNVVSNKADGSLGGLTPEQSKKLLQDIETLKAKQLESQKMLEELEKDE